MPKAAIQPTKKSYYTLPYTEFTRTPENLRENVDQHVKDTGLLDLIKNDGGVRDLVFVLPSSYNIDGKRIIWEGNSRHYCLEQLAKDNDYKGSLDLPFVIIPEEVAKSEAERIKFMLSANAIDKRILPQEQWNGIKKLLDIYELNYKDAKDPRNEATKQVAQELGKSVSWIQKMRRVYEATANPKVIELLEDGTIPSVEYADRIQAKAKKADMPVEDFISEVLDCARADDKTRVSDKYIDQAFEALTVSVEEALNDDQSEEVQEVEEIEEVQEVEDRETAIDGLRFFADFIQSLNDKDFARLSEKDLLAAAKKVDGIYNKFDKVLKKAAEATATEDDVEIVEE
jgi:hypothetical protein